MDEPFLEASGALDGLSGQMARLESITGQFGRTLSHSLAQGIAQGKGFEEILHGLGDRLLQISLNAAFKPLEGVMNGVFGALGGAAGSLVSATLGGGGSPGLFGSGLPNALPGPAAAPMTIHMAISTPDAESFKRSEAQISAALARAVARGQRSL